MSNTPTAPSFPGGRHSPGFHLQALALLLAGTFQLIFSASPSLRHNNGAPGSNAESVKIRRELVDGSNSSSSLPQILYESASSLWESTGLDALSEVVAIDSLSPNYNSDWQSDGTLGQSLDFFFDYAVSELGAWVNVSHQIFGGEEASPPTPPFLLLKIPGSKGNATSSTKSDCEGGEDEFVMIYSHSDTQPYDASQWTTTDDPTVTKRMTAADGTNRLYGRGTADDKYGPIAAIIAAKALMQAGQPYPTMYILVETEEESGSENLEAHLEQAFAVMGGKPKVAFILDSGGFNNAHFWNIRILRGIISAILKVEVSESAAHSGVAGGIVSSPFRVMNDIIVNRVEALNGTVIADPLVYEPTESEIAGAAELASAMGDQIYVPFGFLPGVSPIPDPSQDPTQDDLTDMVIRNHLLSQLTILGWNHETIPDLTAGGNVIQPYIEVRLSFRTAPSTDSEEAFPLLKDLIEKDPPYGAIVTLELDNLSSGFNADPHPSWYEDAANEASLHTYGDNMLRSGDGGTIPFVGSIQRMLGSDTIIHNTGLFDTSSNGHAPDESLDVEAAKKLTGALSYILNQVALYVSCDWE